MKKINLRELYPDAYTTDFFVNVTEDVLETIRASERAEAAYERKMYRYKAQYSLDCENGIENTVLTKPQTPEMVLEEKQLQKQVYVGTEWFEDADREFHRTPDLTDCTSATMEALIKNTERADMVATNIENVPIEDYREIVATQNGFDSYEEMYNEGVRIGNGYDKEPEPIVPAWEQKKKSKVKSFDLHPDIPMSERHNFDLANNQVEEVNKKERFHRNYAAIKVLKDCQNENRFATPDEQKILSRYVGWGGIPEAFDERAGAWHTEYAMLKNILTPEEYASARESTLTAFYTPPEVSTAIYKVLEQMGFQEGNLLEPSCGIGNFIGMLPKSMENAKVYGVELDTISAGIAQQLYQKSSIAAQGFEEVNVPDSFFDGVIGNVPFGDFKVSDKRYRCNKGAEEVRI